VEPAARPKSTLFRRLAPWLVAAGVLAWLFNAIRGADLEAALARAPLWPFLGLAVVYIVVTLLGDTFATWATFRSALPEARLTFRETLDIRGASYLLAIVHYGAGQGGIAYFVSRRGIPVARAAGAVMLIMGVNVMVVALIALAGVVAGGAPAAPALRWLVLGLACAFPAYLAVIAARPGLLIKRKLLAPLFDAGVRGHAVAVAARLPHVLWLVVGQTLALYLFGVQPPLAKSLALLPLVFVVAVLPISPAGIGTSQAMLVALFTPWAPGDTPEARRAAVLASGLALQLLGLIVQAILGLVFLRRLTRTGIVAEGVSTPTKEP
jgi:uncharacterized membrane protein YbhN (UPF0104 family)